MNENAVEKPATAGNGKPRKLGLAGTVIGIIALGIAIFHFFFGPLEQPPSVEEVVAETAVKLKGAFAAKLKGETYEAERRSEGLKPDDLLRHTVTVLGFVAIVLAAIGFIQHEDWRASSVALALGAGAIVFQFTVAVIGAVLAIILVVAVLGAMGLS